MPNNPECEKISITLIKNIHQQYINSGFRSCMNSEQYCYPFLYKLDDFIYKKYNSRLDVFKECSTFKNLRKNMAKNLDITVLTGLSTDHTWIKEISDSVFKEFILNKTGMRGKDFMCPICHDLLELPVKTKCNHIFCMLCIKTHMRDENGTCPMCRREVLLEDVSFVDMDITTAMEWSKVNCPNHVHGCKKKIHEITIEEHLENCMYRKIKCINPGCNVTTSYKDRLQHFELCDKAVCKSHTYGCEFVGTLEDIENHSTDCMYSKIREGMLYDMKKMLNNTIDHINQSTRERNIEDGGNIPNISMRAFLNYIDA